MGVATVRRGSRPSQLIFGANGPRGPLKGPRCPFKGPRGPFKGPRGPFKGPRGSSDGVGKKVTVSPSPKLITGGVIRSRRRWCAYRTGPGARSASPRARSIGMEQRPGRKSKGFWGVWNKIPAAALGEEVFGRSHIHIHSGTTPRFLCSVVFVFVQRFLV